MLLRNTFELPALFRLCSDRLDSMLVSRVKRACDFFLGLLILKLLSKLRSWVG